MGQVHSHSQRLGWSPRGHQGGQEHTGAPLTVPGGCVLCGAPGGELPAWAEELCIGVHLFVKEGEPWRGSGLHRYFGALFWLLGARESQIRLKVRTSEDSPARQPRWPCQSHTRHWVGLNLCPEGPIRGPDIGGGKTLIPEGAEPSALGNTVGMHRRRGWVSGLRGPWPEDPQREGPLRPQAHLRGHRSPSRGCGGG